MPSAPDAYDKVPPLRRGEMQKALTSVLYAGENTVAAVCTEDECRVLTFPWASARTESYELARLRGDIHLIERHYCPLSMRPQPSDADTSDE